MKFKIFDYKNKKCYFCQIMENTDLQIKNKDKKCHLLLKLLRRER